MSVGQPTRGPVRIQPADRELRRRAAKVVAIAWLTRWELPAALATIATVSWVCIAVGSYRYPSWWWLIGISAFFFFTVVLSLGQGFTAWRSTGAAQRAGEQHDSGVVHGCYYLSSGSAEAVIFVRPDTRRGQEVNDHQLHTRAAWPKARGAGSQLRTWIIEAIHATGGRATSSATPWGAGRLYRGSVIDGWTPPGLVRIASKPRETSSGRPEASRHVPS